MGCASCDQKMQSRVHLSSGPQGMSLLGANDIQIIENGQVRTLAAEDWPPDMHKLLIFIPEAFTPVCQSELGAMNDWYERFHELGCVLIAACVDSAARLLDWFNTEPLLADPTYKTLSTYQLPLSLNILENGRSKRATVFIPKNGEIVKQEYPLNVGRSFAELHRMVYAYTQDDYCGEGWQSPTDS
jgi:mycoredoxin-dependent peroxiredoxin